MLLNECYYREDAAGKKRWFYPSEVDITHDDKGAPVGATAKSDGLPVLLGGIEKMSKSKNNVVEPRDIIGRFGADTARVFVMFAGPPDQSAGWSDSGAEGAYRYLRRLWAYGARHAASLRHAAGTDGLTDGCSDGARELRRTVHGLLRQVSTDYERLQYNTVISGAMKMLNAIEDTALDDAEAPADAAVRREAFGLLLRTLYPAAPHLTHVLWSSLGYVDTLGELNDAPWPQVDESALLRSEIELVLQVGGKLRGSVRVPAEADRATIEAAALAHPDCIRFVDGRPVRKVVIVPGRLVNVVV
jgi:leucyl-tRNA synthetase